jgi:hypothetical protein
MLIRDSPEGWCLVDVQSVADDISSASDSGVQIATTEATIPVMPPFPAMWLEWRFPQDRQQRWNAAAVTHNSDEGMMGVCLLQEVDRRVFFYAMVFVQFNESDGIDVWDYKAAPEVPESLIENCVVLVTQSMARMHCQNVTIRPRGPTIAGSTPPVNVYRGNVWHDIVVAPAKFATENATSSSEHRTLRHHRVRGHYADYRNGAGLFGRIKGLFWVSDHTRGDKAVGEVKATYSIR